MSRKSLNQLNNEIAQLKNSDPLGQLISKYKIQPWQGALAILMVNLVSSVILAAATGTFLPLNGERGFINDYPTWAFEFIFHPTVVGGFIWLQSSISKLFHTILVDEQLIPPSLSLGAIRECRTKLNSRLPFYVSLLSGLLAGALTVLVFMGNTNLSWLTRSELLAWSRGPIYLVLVYILTFTLYDVVVTIETLNRLFKNDIQIKILHPDNVGGLGAIGRFVANLGYALGATAITLTVTVLYDISSFIQLKDQILIVYVASFLVFTLIIFILPIYSSHVAMQRRKNIMLTEISGKISPLIARVVALPPADVKLKTISAQIDRHEQANRLIAGLPTWPISFHNLGKYFGLALTPLTPTLITYLLGLLI